MDQETKNKIKAGRAATRAKRTEQVTVVRDLKLDTKQCGDNEREKLRRMFLEAKWLWNQTVTSSINIFDHNAIDLYPKTVNVIDKDGVIEERPIRTLGSHMKADVIMDVRSAIKTLSTLKKKGKKVGALKPRGVRNSISLRSSMFRMPDKKHPGRVYITGVGWLKARGLKQIIGYETSNAKLVRKADGYHLMVTCHLDEKLYEEARATRQLKKRNGQPKALAVGIDMGYKTTFSLSTGEEVQSRVGESERSKRHRKAMARGVKGSNAWVKHKKVVANEALRASYRKDEAARQLMARLLSSYEFVFLQDENLRAWAKRNGFVRGGKVIQTSPMGRVKIIAKANKQCFVLSRFEATTQYCPCGARVKLSLNNRIFECLECGYTCPRDKHAAQNMVRLGVSSAPLERREEILNLVDHWAKVNGCSTIKSVSLNRALKDNLVAGVKASKQGDVTKDYARETARSSISP